jgi:hypothetical protein
MAWTFESPTGRYFDPLGAHISTGYSGHGVGVDNLADEAIPNEGPIPEGSYHMGEPYTDPESGPLTMRLTPLPGTNTFGRAGFKIHGDSIPHPGQASLGCAVADHPTRVAMSESTDQVFDVVRAFQPLVGTEQE